MCSLRQAQVPRGSRFHKGHAHAAACKGTKQQPACTALYTLLASPEFQGVQDSKFKFEFNCVLQEGEEAVPPAARARRAAVSMLRLRGQLLLEAKRVDEVCA